MEDTHSGDTGVCAAGHVEEELRNVSVHAPIPRLKTEEENAVDWLVNQGAVTPKGAQLMEVIHRGLLGLSAVLPVTVQMELSIVTAHARIHHQQMVENGALGPIERHRCAITQPHAQPQFTVPQFARILLQISIASSGQTAEVALLQESRIGAKKLAVVVKLVLTKRVTINARLG